jgi:hypothetical protein
MQFDSNLSKPEKRFREYTDRVTRFTGLLSENKQEIYTAKKAELCARIVALSKKQDPLYLAALVALDVKRDKEIEDAGITRAYAVEIAKSVLESSKEQAARDYEVHINKSGAY